MNSAHEYFQLMLTALRNEDHALPVSDAHCAEIIRDALQQYNHDEQNLPADRQHAENMFCSFDMLHFDIENATNARA